MFNSDDSNRGYEEGFQAGLEGKNKNFNNSGKSWKFAFLGENAINSYNEAYNKGYDDGQRKQNGLYINEIEKREQGNKALNKRLSNGIRTGDNDSIQIGTRINNIRSIKEAMSFMLTTYQNTITRLEELKDEYKQKLDELNNEGLLDDIYEDLLYEYETTSSFIDNLCYNIENNDIANLKDIQNKVEEFENSRRRR